MAVYQSLKLTETGYDVLENTSRVKVVWTSRQTGESHNDNKKTAKYYLWVNGEKTAYSIAYTLPAQSTQTILSRTFIVPHAQDGTGSVTVQTWMDTGISAGEVELKKTLTLTPIPRASTLSAPDGCIGSEVTVTVSKKSQQYVHSVAASFGSLSGYLDGEGALVSQEVLHTAGALPFFLPESFYAQIPDSPSGVCTLTCRTYLDSQPVGQPQTATFTVTADPALSAPLVTGSAADTDPVTLALTGSGDILISHHSCVLCAMTAQARNGAVLTGMEINGVPTDGTLEFPGVRTGTFRLAATDSRGYRTELVLEKQLLPYTAPTLKATAARLGPTSQEAQLTVSGGFTPGSFGAEENRLRLSYTLPGEDPVEFPAETAEDGFSGSCVIPGLAYTGSYPITVTAEDALSAVRQTLTVTPGLPVFDWGREDFTFRVPVYYRDKTLEAQFLTKEAASMEGHPIKDLGLPTEETDAATKAYADGKMSATKLWENASPTSSFKAQTVSLDLSGYDHASVYYKNIPSGSAYFSSGIVPVGRRVTMQYVSTSASMYHRHADITQTGVVFNAGQLNGESSASAIVPVAIYGWKGAVL